MAEGLATLFQHDPFYTVNQLPMDEQKLIAQLINLKFDECVEVPRNNEKHLMMQKVAFGGDIRGWQIPGSYLCLIA